jgi:tRNA-splicing ligase RtcB
MQVITQDGSRPIKAWVDTREIAVPGTLRGTEWGQPVYSQDTVRVEPNIEESAMKQLRNLATLPFIHKNGVAVMPDVHCGIGATVGSVIATTRALIPAAAGVDLGCGMNAVRTSLTASDLPDSLAALRHSIERAVPTGDNAHTKDEKIAANLVRMMTSIGSFPIGVAAALERGGRGKPLRDRSAAQLGSLGGGNHFIEVCLDQAQQVWVMLHSGSRGIGNIIGRHFIERAKRHMESYFIHLPDTDLAYLPEKTEDFDAYLGAVSWAQAYALENRRAMMEAVLDQLARAVKPFQITDEGVNCHHNYIAHENHFGENLYVTRKGAVRAREGDRVIIPGSMGQRSYIARGKGNPESYCSCSHGAGRVMSRTAAKARFTADDLAAQTAGVECRKDAALVDEIPGAYKDIDQVMTNQSDLVEIEHTLKQILCVKGA